MQTQAYAKYAYAKQNKKAEYCKMSINKNSCLLYKYHITVVNIGQLWKNISLQLDWAFFNLSLVAFYSQITTQGQF